MTRNLLGIVIGAVALPATVWALTDLYRALESSPWTYPATLTVIGAYVGWIITTLGQGPIRKR